MRDRIYFSVQRSLLLLLVFSFLFPLSYDKIPVYVYPFDMVLLPMAGLWLARIFYKRTIRVTLPGIALAVLVAWILVSSALVVRPDLTVEGGLLWFRGAVIFSLFQSLYRSAYDYSDVVTIVTIILVLQASLAIVQGIFQVDIGALNQYFGQKESLTSYRTVAGYRMLRAQGTLGNPNTLASWIAVLLPLVAATIPFTEDRSTYRVRIATVILSLTGLLFALSRGITAIVFSSLCLLGLLVYGRRIRNAIPWRITSFVTTWLISMTTVLMYIVHISNNKRADLIRMAVDLFSTSPVTGIGYNNFVVSSNRMLETDVFLRGMTTSVHNIPLLFLVETGVIGFSLFLLFVCNVFVRILTRSARSNWNDPESIGYLVAVAVSVIVMQLYLTPISSQFLPLLLVLYGTVVGATRTEVATLEQSS